MKPRRDYEGQQQKMLHDIAFAQVAFSEQALAIMSTRPGEQDSFSAGAGGGGSSGNGGEAVGGDENWDRRLARPENFLQLCRDDTCGKMRTLKVSTDLQAVARVRRWPVRLLPLFAVLVLIGGIACFSLSFSL